MIVSSRPLRFLTAVVGGWIGIRALILWPVPAVAPRADATVKNAPPQRARPGAPASLAKLSTNPAGSSLEMDQRNPKRGSRAQAALFGSVGTQVPVLLAGGDLPELSSAREDSPFLPALQIGASPSLYVGGRSSPLTSSRLAGSSWAIVRPGGRARSLTPQLGGSQAGARLTYALGDSRRLALAGRVSSALQGQEREVSFGLDWRPTALPIHLIAEQRFALGHGGQGGPAVGLIGGAGPVQLGWGLHVEGYAQAGAIARRGVESFADGSIRLSRPLMSAGGVRIDAGAGLWGGAQRGIARLDTGPSVVMAVPVGERRVRVSLDCGIM